MSETKHCTAKLVCDGVELIKGVNWAKAKTASAQCNDCRGFRAHINDALKARVAERLGISSAKDPKQKVYCIAQMPAAERRTEMEKQREIDRENLESGHTEPNKQVSSPKPKKVPSSVKHTVTRDEWNDSAISSVLRHNLQLRYNVCEFTGAPAEFCHESHILSRKLCREWDHPEWVEDEENVIFILGGLNQAMNPDVGYWLEPSGLFAPPPGGEFAEWMVKLGIPDIHIKMTEGRIRFARMAAWGRS